MLLRTSMVRSLVRAPRECMESAADLAAFFSDARRADEVKVMYIVPHALPCVAFT